MKIINISFCTIALCAFATIVSCSSDNDNIVSNQEQEEGLTTITVGAPTIESDGSGNTRVAFAYDNGLNMSWEANDEIRGTGYYDRTVGETTSWYKSFYDKPGTADASGATTTFTLTGWNDLDSRTNPAYTITYHPGLESSTTTAWKTATIPSSQSQSGNGNTAHLKANYYAILQNVNTSKNITFSQQWASSHASNKPINDGEACGKFFQNSCLKFDLMVPYSISGKTLSNVMAIKLRLYQSDGTTYQNCIQWKNDGTGSKSWQFDLSLSGIDMTGVDADHPLHLVGYVMLPICDWTIPSGTVINVGIRLDAEGHYFTKKMTALTSAWTLEAGKLGIIKLNSSNWTYNKWGLPD